MLVALAADGCRSAETGNVLVGLRTTIGQFQGEGTAGNGNGGGQSVAGGRLGEVYRSLRSQNLAVTNRAFSGRGAVRAGRHGHGAGPGVALDDRFVEAHGQVGTVECVQCRVVGLRAALAVLQRGDFDGLTGVPEHRLNDLVSGGEGELEGHLQGCAALQVGFALVLALGVNGRGEPQACTAVQACTDATAGGEGAAAGTLRGAGGCARVSNLNGVGVQAEAGVIVVGWVRVERLGENTVLNGRNLRVDGGCVRRDSCGCRDGGGAPRGTLDEGAAVQTVSGVRGLRRSHGLSF